MIYFLLNRIYIEVSKTYFSLEKLKKRKPHKNTKQAKIKQQMNKIKQQKSAIFYAPKTLMEGKIVFCNFCVKIFFLKKNLVCLRTLNIYPTI